MESLGILNKEEKGMPLAGLEKMRWIALDWGTSNLRIWAMDQAGSVLDSYESDQGMSRLKHSDFEPVFNKITEEWRASWALNQPLPVVACGMVGARQGWFEIPYQTAPCLPIPSVQKVEMDNPEIDLYIAAGIQQLAPADVMRGEETQIAGLLAEEKDYTGTICLPGTHTKWVSVEGGKIEFFQTVMTGEIFASLQNHTILKQTLGHWSDEVFEQSVLDAFQNPEMILQNLFSIRAKAVLQGDDGGISRLSGLLIGQELAGSISFWQEREVILLGDAQLSRHYQNALKLVGGYATIMNVENLTLSGLFQAYQTIKNQK